MGLKQDLPLLNALVVFEAAARTSSFTLASQELAIAQSAVSRHVANLEAYFSLELFRRRGKRLELTPGGQRLADAVAIGLGHIRLVLKELRRETTAAIFTIGCSHDTAYLWLMPRFGALRDIVGDVEVRLITTNDYRELDAEDIDLSIRFGQRRDWPDADCLELFPERAFAICSPAFLEEHPALRDEAEAMRDVPLLYASQRGIQWRDWFAKAGVPPPALKASTFSSYTSVLYEVLAGRGVALAWAHLLGDLMERGAIVKISDVMVESDSAYYAVFRGGSGSLAARVATWLQQAVAMGASPLIMTTPYHDRA